MKTFLAVAVSLLALSCSRDSDTIIGPRPPPPAGYPFTLTFTAERYAAFADEWQRFSILYDVSSAIPAFDSVLMTPLQIPAVDLLPATAETLSIEQAANLLLSFANQWRNLFNTDGRFYVLSESDVPWARSYRIQLWRDPRDQVHLSGLNHVEAAISHDGVLQVFRSTCTPMVPITAPPRYSLEDAVHIVSGTKLIYYSWTGEDTLLITPDMIQEAVLGPTLIPTFALPSYRFASIEYRNCWRLKVPVFHLYVDAVTGDFLDYKEQYVIF